MASEESEKSQDISLEKEQKNSSTRQSRSERRRLTKHLDDPGIRTSLCSSTDPNSNLERLKWLEYEWTRPGHHLPHNKLERLKGLEDVLKQLMLPGGDFPGYLQRSDNSSYMRFLTFKDAFQIYSSHISNPVSEERFTLDILDQEMGLSVNVIKLESARYIVLNNAAIVLPSLILHSKATAVDSKGNTNARFLIGQNMLQQLMKRMDSEYDKKTGQMDVDYQHDTLTNEGNGC